MSVTLNLRTNEKCIVHALNRRSLRRSFAFVLGLGITSFISESTLLGQYASGDLPASPWSNRGENLQTRRVEESSRPNSGRLRQPGTIPNEGFFERRSFEQPASESARPAPVILMGPSNALPSQALTQKTPINAQSGWHRVQAGGLIIEAEGALSIAEQESNPDLLRGHLAARTDRKLGAGLPDRIDDENSSKLSSQMASARSSFGSNEPITLRSPSPTFGNEIPDAQMEPLSLTSSSSAMSNLAKQAKASTTQSRSESIRQLGNNGQVPSLVQSVQELRIAENPIAASVEKVVATTQEPAKTAPAVDDAQMKKFALAQRVSHELLSNTPTISAKAPEALESLPGWQSVERELKQRLDRCDSLLKRGVVLSARDEASQGLLRLYRTMDLHRGSLYSEPAFEKAIVAFREESDFQKNLRVSQANNVQAIVDSHATEALKNRPLDSTSPEMAAMHYRWYARYQLVSASDGHPWAADLLYAYGKTLEKEADLNPAYAVMFRSQAVVCYQAATQIKPSQSDAANQLGYALIHLDRMDDAYAALSASIQNKPNANAWNNLAEVFRRQGKPADAEYAVKQATALESASPQFNAENPEITEVDPAVFARYSPVPTMVGNSQNFTPSNLQASGPNGITSSAAGKRSSKSLFSKFFQK